MALTKKTTESGTKAYQRDDKEDRSLAYRLWRREAETAKRGQRRNTPYTSDIDQVEYVFYKDKIHPVAIFEITRYDFDEYDGASEGWAKYRAAILNRYFRRDAQGKFIKTMAQKLDVPGYIILFRHDLEAFWIFDVCHRDALWERKTPEEYREWLESLKTNKLESLKKDEQQG